MALTIGEASDVNTVLHHVLNLGDVLGKVPGTEEAIEAAARLADKANKALGAGLNGDRVRSAWPEGNEADTTVEQADAYLRACGIDPESIREVADHPFTGTERVPGYCKRCGCSRAIHPA